VFDFESSSIGVVELLIDVVGYGLASGVVGHMIPLTLDVVSETNVIAVAEYLFVVVPVDCLLEFVVAELEHDAGVESHETAVAAVHLFVAVGTCVAVFLKRFVELALNLDVDLYLNEQLYVVVVVVAVAVELVLGVLALVIVFAEHLFALGVVELDYDIDVELFLISAA